MKYRRIFHHMKRYYSAVRRKDPQVAADRTRSGDFTAERFGFISAPFPRRSSVIPESVTYRRVLYQTLCQLSLSAIQGSF